MYLNNEMGRQFGKGVAHYLRGRKNYPAELFDWMKQLCPPSFTFLDLACGTGIATKQLWDAGYHHLTGCDIDPAMLQVAKQICLEVTFLRSDVAQMPFKDAAFDCVTIFGAFHWFCEPNAIQEMTRILKPGGLLWVVNKDDLSPIDVAYIRWLQQASGSSLSDPKQGYHPAAMLQTCRFEIVSTREWDSREVFTLEEALSFCQSIGAWNGLTAEQKLQCAPKISEFLAPWMKQGELMRPIRTRCVLARAL